MGMNSKQVLIIGGGIAGPVLAIFLQRAGFSPQIFESTNGPSDAGGALGLAANGMHVLAAAGVIEPVREVSVTADNWSSKTNPAQSLRHLPVAILHVMDKPES